MTDNRGKFRGWFSKIRQSKYGRPLKSGEVKALGYHDYKSLIESIADRVSGGSQDCFIEIGITESKEANAWAFRDVLPGGIHGVIVTTELLSRYQIACAAVQEATLQCLRSSQIPPEFQRIWGGLPRDELHASLFAQLVVHVSVVYLMHHESAHILIGHTSLESNLGGKSESIEHPVSEMEELGSPAASLSWIISRTNGVYQSQSNEMDADSHAIVWTDHYLKNLNLKSSSLDAIDARSRDIVRQMDSEDFSRRFLLISACWCLYFILGSDDFDPNSLGEGTHPHVGVRLAMLLVAERQIALQSDPTSDPMFDAAGFSGIIGMKLFPGAASLGDVFEKIGYSGAMDNWARVVAHVNFLGKVRKDRDSIMSIRRIKSELPMVVWWQ